MGNAIKEQQFFIKTLHHANHCSYVSRLRLLNGKGQYSSTNLAEIESYDKDYDTYVSLHSFSRYGRLAENIREITCIYYDLDMHDEQCPVSFIEDCTDNTLQVLYDAIYGDESLPEPTIITRTGRGLGIFYVLERSIACAKGRNAGQVEFWKLIYRRLGEKIKTMLIPENNLLADDPEALLELDEKVICDVSRVTRMPGTWNQTVGKECRVLFPEHPEDEPRYYTLKELSAYVFSKVYTATRKPEDPLVEKPKVVIKRKRSGNIVEFDFFLKAFLQERIEALEKLQAFRKGKGIGCRDYMCFTYYNHAKQLYGTEQAINMLVSFNNAYEDPLPESEIRNIIKGINRCSSDTYEGYYKLTNEWIIKNLKVSVLERDILDFDVSKRKLQRKLAHQETLRVREERNRKITEYIEHHQDETYVSIAARFDVSLRTVKSIAKDAGIGRYRRSEGDKLNKQEDFNVTKRKLQRKLAHQETVRVRKERNREIAEYIRHHQNDTYASIAVRFNVSLRTVKSIAKDAGIRRYGRSKVKSAKGKKSEKICLIVCCDSPAKVKGKGSSARIAGQCASLTAKDNDKLAAINTSLPADALRNNTGRPPVWLPRSGFDDSNDPDPDF